MSSCVIIYYYISLYLYLRLSTYTYRYMSYCGSNGVIPRWVSLQGLQNVARICWSEWLKVDDKPVIIYSDLVFVLGEPNLTNKNLKCVVCVCVCWFHLSLGSPRGSRVFQAGKTSMKSIIFANYHSRELWQGRCGFFFIKGYVMMEIEDIQPQKWEMMSFWFDRFSQGHGVLFVVWEASQTTSQQLLERPTFGKDTKMLQPTNHVEHNSSLDKISHLWGSFRLGKRKDWTSNLLTCAYLDDWNSRGRIRVFVSTIDDSKGHSPSFC